MKKFWFIIVLSAVAFAGYSGLKLFSAPSDAPASVQAVIPDSVLWYAEAADLREVWSAMGQTEAWKDLQDSALLSALTEGELARAVLAQLGEISEKIGYPIDDQNLLKFVGTECGLALALMEDSDQPEFLLATRLDAEALKRDFLLGDADWSALQSELEKRSEAADLEVERVSLEGGYVLTTLTLPDEKQTALHAVLLEDVLCLSTSASLARAAVRTRSEPAKHSLAQLPAFRSELAKLESERFGFDWWNLDGIRDERETIRSMCGDSKDGRGTMGALSAILDATLACPSLARSWSLPEGDLYRASWQYSRSPENVFDGLLSPDIGEWSLADPIFLMEAHELGQLAKNARGSGAWEHIAESGAMKLAIRSLEEQLAKVSFEAFEVEPPSMHGSSRFERIFLEHVGVQQLESLFRGDMHVSLAMPREDMEEPEWVFSARLGVDGIFLAQALLGGFSTAVETQVLQWGGQNVVLPATGPRESIGMTLVGDVFLIGDAKSLERRLTQEADAPAGEVAQVKARFEPGYHGFAYLDFERILSARSFGEAVPPGFEDLFSSAMAPYYSAALYGSADMETVEIQTLIGLPELVDGTSSPSGRPELFACLPEETIAAISAHVDLGEMLGIVEQIVRMGTEGGEEDVWAELTQAISDFLGIEFESQLIPAFGSEFGYAYVFSDVPVEELGGAPIPGIVFAVQVQDEEVLQGVLDTLFDAGNEFFFNESYPMRLIDEGGLIVLDSDEGQLFLRPGVGFLQGFLVLVSDAELYHRLASVWKGQEARLVDTPSYLRAFEMQGGDSGEAWGFMDWRRLLKQVALYGDLFDAVVPTSVPFPEYPEDGDEDEWQRRMEAWEAAQTVAVEERADVLETGLEAIGFIDFISSRTAREEAAIRSHILFGFVPAPR